MYLSSHSKIWNKQKNFFRLQSVWIRNNLVVISNSQTLLTFKLTLYAFFSRVYVITQVGLMTSSRDYILWMPHEFLPYIFDVGDLRHVKNSNSIISFRILSTFEISSTVCFSNISSFLLLKIFYAHVEFVMINDLCWYQTAQARTLISLMMKDFFKFSSISFLSSKVSTSSIKKKIKLFE